MGRNVSISIIPNPFRLLGDQSTRLLVSYLWRTHRLNYIKKIKYCNLSWKRHVKRNRKLSQWSYYLSAIQLNLDLNRFIIALTFFWMNSMEILIWNTIKIYSLRRTIKKKSVLNHMKLEEFFLDLKKGKSWILGWVVFSDMLRILLYFYSIEIALIYEFQSISLIRTNTVEFKLSLCIHV